MLSRWQKTVQNATNLTGLVESTYNLLTRHSLPQKSGKLQLQGLHEGVDIVTDRYGVPHIYAHNEDDLYYAQGYVHAQDRLWQMEINRRLGAGRLSELFGAQTLETDRFCRRLGMHRVAAAEVSQLPENVRRLLSAYASGINAFIVSNRHKLPIEFTLLHCKPEDWQVADIIQWSKVQAWSLSSNWETELIRARLVEKLGAEGAARLEAGYDPEHPLIVPPGVSYQGVNLGLLEQYQHIKDISGFGGLGGSNNWVVDGSMTQSGSPILCNDPHLKQNIPSIWYECHLVAGAIDVIGASFPGTPGIVIGHNQHIAWGVTNAVSDVQDLYVEKFNPHNPQQYEFQGQWEEAQLIREEIQVKGLPNPIIEEVRITRHGPIISTMPSATSDPDTELPLALRWTALEQGHIVSAVQKLNCAHNWTEFLQALRDWDTPPQNFVYADRTGNIGYIMAGAIPIRAQGQALLPPPGWTGTYEWTGFIPFEELPQTYNPEQHFIVTANNRVVGDNYPYYITNEWSNGYRAQRISDLLTSKSALTLSDMAAIQSDQYALPALAVVPHILKINADTPLKQAAHEILQTWDYILSPTSIGATIYTTFLRKLEGIVLAAVLGDDKPLQHSYQGVGAITLLSSFNSYINRSKPWLIRLLNARDESWFAHSAIPNGPTSWENALALAFEGTIDELKSALGGNILRWQYGSLHKITYSHPLVQSPTNGAMKKHESQFLPPPSIVLAPPKKFRDKALGTLKALEPLFNRGPYPLGGDGDTVSVSTSSPIQPEAVLNVASLRLILDLHTPDASLAIHAPGQSGHPGSKHYSDFIQLWLEGKYHPLLYSREQVEAAAEETLHLSPEQS